MRNERSDQVNTIFEHKLYYIDCTPPILTVHSDIVFVVLLCKIIFVQASNSVSNVLRYSVSKNLFQFIVFFSTKRQ